MKNEFIPYEQALALKELGFDEPCFIFYTSEKQLIIARGDILQSSVENAPTAPLYQQAFRWFREKYDLIYKISSLECFNSGYVIEIYNISKSGLLYSTTSENGAKLNTYEEAELECLKKLIEICGIQQK